MNARKREVSEARSRAAKIRWQAMTDPVANPLCQACGFAYPPIMHMHHVRPIAESADISDEHVWLCPNCHAMVHEIRRVYYSKRKPSNYQLRISHLGYWLTDICDPTVAKKLHDIASKTLNTKGGV